MDLMYATDSGEKARLLQNVLLLLHNRGEDVEKLLRDASALDLINEKESERVAKRVLALMKSQLAFARETTK